MNGTTAWQSGWTEHAVRYSVRRGSASGAEIKGEVSSEPEEGLFAAYSASGQDVWTSSYRFSGDGIVLSAVGARCGKCFRARGRWNVVANTQVFLPRPGFDADYLWYVFNSESFWLKGGSAQPYVIVPHSLSQKLAFPPLEKQRAIAAFLDRKTAAIDALIAKKERLIELLQEKRQALITQAVTKGLDPDVPLRTVPTPWFDRVPAHWKLTVVKRTAAPTANAFTDGDWIEAPFVTDSGIRLLQTGNVGIGRFKEQGFRYVSESTFRDLRCTEVHPGNVLICRLDGPVGRACLAPDLGCRMITSVDNAILRPSREFDAGFLVYALSSQLYLDWVGALCRVGGGHRFRISRSMLGEFEVPAPPLAEQQEIRSFLDRTCKRTDVVISRVGRHVELLREYRQALISAAVTGKIEIPAEEAA